MTLSLSATLYRNVSLSVLQNISLVLLFFFPISCYEIHDIIALEECVPHSLTVRNGGSKKFSHGYFELLKLIY